MVHFMLNCLTATARYYSEAILKRKVLKEKLKKLRPRLAQKNVFLLHDNSPSHTTSSTVELINFKVTTGTNNRIS